MDSLPNLLSLNISSNLLHSLPANPILGAPKLRQLNLASNRFAKLPSNFANESENGIELEELNLAGNIISEVGNN
jgi:Leucine-rich repeat (LRR) protein